VRVDAIRVREGLGESRREGEGAEGDGERLRPEKLEAWIDVKDDLKPIVSIAWAFGLLDVHRMSEVRYNQGVRHARLLPPLAR